MKKSLSLLILSLLAILLVACGSSETSSEEAAPAEANVNPAILDARWEWESFTDTENGSDPVEITEQSQYVILLKEDGSFQARADCNLGGGTYTGDDTQIKFNVDQDGFAACPASAIADRFLTLMVRAGSYELDGEKLIINTQGDTGSMTFVNKGGLDILE